MNDRINNDYNQNKYKIRRATSKVKQLITIDVKYFPKRNILTIERESIRVVTRRPHRRLTMSARATDTRSKTSVHDFVLYRCSGRAICIGSSASTFTSQGQLHCIISALAPSPPPPLGPFITSSQAFNSKTPGE